MFHAVEFLEENGHSTVAVALDSWIEKLNGEYLCWWPTGIKNTNQLTKLYDKVQGPDKTSWTLHNCKVHATKETLEAAKKKVDKILDASTDIEDALITTDDDSFVLHSRIMRKRRAGMDDDSAGKSTKMKEKMPLSQSQTLNKDLTPSYSLQLVDNSFGKSEPGAAMNYCPIEPPKTYQPKPNVPSSTTKFNSTSSSPLASQSKSALAKPLTEETFLIYYSKMMAEIVSLKTEVINLQKAIENGIKTPGAKVRVEIPEEFKKWPLRSIEQLVEQENYLSDNVNQQQAVAWIEQHFDEKKWGQMARSALTMMLSGELQLSMTFSEKAKSNLLKFEGTRSYVVVKDAIKAGHPGVTPVEIRACIQNWLQHKTDRKVKFSSGSTTSSQGKSESLWN